MVYNFFSKNLIRDIEDLVLKEIFIGPILVNIPRGEIDDYSFLGTIKNKTIIEHLPYFKKCEFMEGFEHPNFDPTLWGLVDYHICEADLPYDMYPEKVNFEILEFSSRISPNFLRQTILIEYAKYTQQELVLNEEGKIEFRYLLRKSAYFPPRNIKEINELINDESDIALNTIEEKKSKIKNQEKEKTLLNKAKIEKFWDWLSKEEAKLVVKYGDDYEGMLQAIFTKFEKIGSECSMMLEQTESDKIGIVITAQGIREQIPEVEEICQYAPALAHFSVSAFRQADLDCTEFSFEEAYKYHIENFYFKYSPTDDNRYNLDVYIVDIDYLIEDDIEVAFLFLDAQLGEYCAMTLINEIEFHKLEDKKGLFRLSDLHKNVKS